MISVFGKRYDFGHEGFGDGFKLEELVSEGYELLGIFNWSDHFLVLGWFDFQGVRKRCKKLVSKVNVFVGKIIEEHMMKRVNGKLGDECVGDFVDVLLDLEMENSLSDFDMVVVLWEMIFRGTDTVAILLEWILARMVLHPDIQSKAQAEIGAFVGNNRLVSDSDLPNLPYLLAIVKESLRVHPSGPFLSWAQLAIHDVYIGKNCIPAGTTFMVNVWEITHDENVWFEPNEFKPERFMDEDQFSMNSYDMTEVIYPKVVTLVLKKTYWMLLDDVEGIYSLRWEDQEMIRKYIEGGVSSSNITIVAANVGGIEVSHAPGATCRRCNQKIMKGEVTVVVHTNMPYAYEGSAVGCWVRVAQPLHLQQGYNELALLLSTTISVCK
ncbi:hypothetical protein IFM89_033139 [Coptis chinensis]|uniref:PARP-type domain-containing protein n=1 Tax=Coptis chinensis TaxID=261450 RepID=A0A835HH53_9MAGN|nr:hypothetical protein IFM89_033139 [Coptis chinensis]